MNAVLPTAFRRIELELAREPGHPVGDASERYTLVAPLDPARRIDAELWRSHRGACRVVRSHAGERTLGHLVHGAGGSWRLVYDQGGQGETGFNLAVERITPGEYISIVRDDGEHPYRVTAVEPL